MLWVGIFAAGYPTGINNVESSIGGQLMGMMTFLPLGFLSGYGASWLLRKANLLRVPPEVELEGLDLAEYGTLVQPEHGVVAEQVVEPDGTLIGDARRRGRRRLERPREPARAVSGVLTLLVVDRPDVRRGRRLHDLGRARAAPAQPDGGGPCPPSLTARPTA